MPFYRIYGLRIRSNQELPTLTPQELIFDQPDVDLRLDELPDWDAELIARALRRGELQDGQKAPLDPESPYVWRTHTQGQNFERWMLQNGMIFIISEKGDKIWARWPPEITLDLVTAYLLGPILGYVVYLRGMLCLHASSVLVGGRAIGLMGVAGAGKSTTSAAMASMGYPLISEDHLALALDGGRWMAQPGYPIVRLWPDSAEMLAGGPANLPELAPGFRKRYLNLAGTTMLASEAAPLADLYILLPRVNADDAPRIQPLDAQQRLMAVIRNSYTTVVLNKTQKGGEFQTLAKLAAAVPVFSVTPHSDPARLPDLCRAIAKHAANPA